MTRISQKKVPIPEGLSHRPEACDSWHCQQFSRTVVFHRNITNNLTYFLHIIVLFGKKLLLFPKQNILDKTALMQSNCAHALILQSSIVQLKTASLSYCLQNFLVIQTIWNPNCIAL